MLSKRDRVATMDMLAAARRAVDYALSVEPDTFAGDRMRVDATMAAVMIVGEASKRISVEGRREIPGVDWRALSDVRQYEIFVREAIDKGLADSNDGRKTSVDDVRAEFGLPE